MKGQTAKEEIRAAAEEFGWDHLALQDVFWAETDLFMRGDVSIKVRYNTTDGVRQAEVQRSGFAMELIAEKKRRQRVLAILRADDPDRNQAVTDDELQNL